VLEDARIDRGPLKQIHDEIITRYLITWTQKVKKMFLCLHTEVKKLKGNKILPPKHLAGGVTILIPITILPHLTVRTVQVQPNGGFYNTNDAAQYVYFLQCSPKVFSIIQYGITDTVPGVKKVG